MGEFRAEGQGELTVTIADNNFSDAKILDNIKFFVQTLLRSRPRGTSDAGKKAANAPLIPAAGGGNTKQTANYFVEASLRLGTEGPLIRLDPDTILPASVGYFR